MRNIAVVGAGRWGRNLIRNFAELGALRAVCDVDPGTLAALGDQFPGITMTSSVADVLEDDRTEGVVIATPAGSHFSLARATLMSGKDVFVEKPLSLKVSEGRDLVELAGQRGRILMVGHLLRYHPAITRLKTLIDEGRFGKLCYITATRLTLGDSEPRKISSRASLRMI